MNKILTKWSKEMNNTLEDLNRALFSMKKANYQSDQLLSYSRAQKNKMNMEFNLLKNRFKHKSTHSLFKLQASSHVSFCEILPSKSEVEANIRDKSTQTDKVRIVALSSQNAGGCQSSDSQNKLKVLSSFNNQE